MTNVTEVPFWTNCPSRRKIPSDIEIRKGKVWGTEQVVLVKYVAPDHCFHVAFDAGYLEEPSADLYLHLEAAIRNLEGAAREAKSESPIR